MPEKENPSFQKRYDHFQKVIFPLQTKVINRATDSITAIKNYLASGKSKQDVNLVKTSLDNWKSAIDEYKKSV
jgi:hypothetical protein